MTPLSTAHGSGIQLRLTWSHSTPTYCLLHKAHCFKTGRGEGLN